jgi:Antimicrobial peptide resistance and lipid A acylation protein PagP
MLKHLLFLLLLSTPAFAEGDWYLHVNGTSRHFHRRDLNEKNWGLGGSYVFHPERLYTWSLEGDFFKDSFDDPSAYVGGAFRRRFKYLDVGVLGFVMYRETAKESIGSKVFPGALPFVEFGSSRVRFRTTYIPQVTGKDDEALTLQLLIKL